MSNTSLLKVSVLKTNCMQLHTTSESKIIQLQSASTLKVTLLTTTTRHDKWKDRQRKQLLVHLLHRTEPSQLLNIRGEILIGGEILIWAIVFCVNYLTLFFVNYLTLLMVSKLENRSSVYEIVWFLV